MFGFGGFGFRRKPRQFEYKARHYDPDAEDREARRKMILGEEYAEGEYRPGMYIREGRMLRMQQREKDRKQRGKSTLYRSVIFVLLIVAVLYLMVNYMGQIAPQNHSAAPETTPTQQNR